MRVAGKHILISMDGEVFPELLVIGIGLMHPANVDTVL